MLALIVRRLTPVLLLTLVACAAAPAPEDVNGDMTIAVFQGYTSYPAPIVAEFAKLGVTLAVTQGHQLETALLGRVRWEITRFDNRCDVVIAVRHPSHWLTYVAAADGGLNNGTTNWWGRAQERHNEIRDENPQPAPLAQPLDVFWPARTTARGEALLLWRSAAGKAETDHAGFHAYLVYGCQHTDHSAVVRIPIDLDGSATGNPRR